VEPERLKRVEILHGPASTLYGSDALGGVIAFTTWDPDDLVARGEGHRRFRLRGGWQSIDNSWVASGQGALARGSHGLLLNATLREGHELDSAAVDASELDPQDWSSEDYAARYVFDVTGGGRLRVDASQFERATRTDVNSLLGYGRFASTTALLGDDRDKTTRLFLDFDGHPGWLDGAISRVFYQENHTEQRTTEFRDPPPAPVRQERAFELDTRIRGLELIGFKDLDFGGATRHRVAAGLEIIDTRLEELRDGYEENLDTGEISDTLLGETLPTRDFPISDTLEIGIFAEDVITFGTGRWELIPGLRVEFYDLETRSDPVYEAAFPDTDLVGLDASDVTPRLALRRSFGFGWSAYAQYTEGFRAPPAEDVNIGFDLPRFRFRAIPNPDLASETSRGYELGLRRFTETQRLSLTWFDTRFRNLIESRALVGRDPESGYLEFQSRNIGEARIYGWDLRYDLDLGHLARGLEGWTLRAAYTYTRGNNETDDTPLNTVSPPQAVIGLLWTSRDQRFNAEMNSIHTSAQDRIDASDGDRFAPGSWFTVDLAAGWRITPTLTLRGALTNLLDETYWRWQDVRNLAPDDPMIPLLARPGRGLSLTLEAEF
jgi:hemoglobin/transferrin/lactoferrin receptor protein